MGRTRYEAILERFHLNLQPQRVDTYLCDCPGIGSKNASIIQEALDLPDEMIALSKPPKDSPARRKREQDP